MSAPADMTTWVEAAHFWAVDLEAGEELRPYSMAEYEMAGGDLDALRADAAGNGDMALVGLVDAYTGRRP